MENQIAVRQDLAVESPPVVALTPGTRIGSYEITALIGMGGMGEVYWTTDTRLDRQVAIKVLSGPVQRTHLLRQAPIQAGFDRRLASSTARTT